MGPCVCHRWYPVAVRLADLIEGKLFLFMDGVLFRHIMNQGLTQQRHIAGGTELARRIQPVNGLKGGVGEA